jgi:prepilin-type N-terminal cleavage/methylation domain-containing protein
MREKGFSVVELVIVVALIGLVSVIVVNKVVGTQSAATTMQCAANLRAFASEIQALSVEGDAPTQEQAHQMTNWDKHFSEYWYIPNNADSNSGHGNDLDGCDEENPGQSLPGRECTPMKFVIVCGHLSHGNESDAKYLFILDEMPPFIVPYQEYRHLYIQDAKWWPKADPGWDQWWGWTPKK